MAFTGSRLQRETLTMILAGGEGNRSLVGADGEAGVIAEILNPRMRSADVMPSAVGFALAVDA